MPSLWLQNWFVRFQFFIKKPIRQAWQHTPDISGECEFKDSKGYIESVKAAWNTDQDPASKFQKEGGTREGSVIKRICCPVMGGRGVSTALTPTVYDRGRDRKITEACWSPA